METNGNSPEKGHGNNQNDQRTGEERNKKSASNSRDDANTGSWNDLRDETVTKDGQYNTDSNDNSGGAGSTGSAATNS
jgi:hypothetical protein